MVRAVFQVPSRTTRFSGFCSGAQSARSMASSDGYNIPLGIGMFSSSVALRANPGQAISSYAGALVPSIAAMMLRSIASGSFAWHARPVLTRSTSSAWNAALGIFAPETRHHRKEERRKVSQRGS